MSAIVQGVDVFFKECGVGEPVLFVHGNPDSADIWDDVIPALQERYRCIAIDLPGFGRSKAPRDFDCSFENLGRFLGAFVERLGVEQTVNLVAHDFGGAFAMAWAAMQPERIRRIVVINHPFFVAEYRWHFWAKIWRTPVVGELSTLMMDWWPVFSESLRMGSKKLSIEKIRHAHTYVTPALKAMILRLYRAADPQRFKEWEPRMLETTSKIPTLVLWGEHDPYIPAWVATKLGAQLVKRFEESGHWVPAEFPQRVSDELLRFFAS
jgi:pimeloyl-ACP methyl ester carboxylesterase